VRILLSSNHIYPASGLSGSSTNLWEFPSGSGFAIHGLVAKGPVEAGHEVSYAQVNRGFRLPIMAEAPVSGADVTSDSNGACPEIVISEAGYDNPLHDVNKIVRRSCREKAIRQFHDRRIAAAYLREYCAEIAMGQKAVSCPTLNPMRE
jgi:hypothetical protein